MFWIVFNRVIQAAVETRLGGKQGHLLLVDQVMNIPAAIKKADFKDDDDSHCGSAHIFLLSLVNVPGCREGFPGIISFSLRTTCRGQ